MLEKLKTELKTKEGKVMLGIVLLSLFYVGSNVYEYVEDKQVEAIKEKYAQPSKDYYSSISSNLDEIKEKALLVENEVSANILGTTFELYELENACNTFLNLNLNEELHEFVEDDHEALVESITLMRDSAVIYREALETYTVNRDDIGFTEEFSRASSLYKEGSVKFLDAIETLKASANY